MASIRIGPTFEAELNAAGLGGKLAGWNEAGQLFGLEALTEAQQALIGGVLAAHDSTRALPPTLDFIGFMALFSLPEQDAIFGSSNPQVRKFIAMATGTAEISLGDPRVAGGVGYLQNIGLLTAGRAAQILTGTTSSSSHVRGLLPFHCNLFQC